MPILFYGRALSDPTEIPPYREASVARPLSHCVSVVSQTIAATPPPLSAQMAHRSPKTDLSPPTRLDFGSVSGPFRVRFGSVSQPNFIGTVNGEIVL